MRPLQPTPAPLPQAVLDDRQRLACLRLIRSSNVGPVNFRELINLYGGATAALEALPELARRGRRAGRITICPAADAEAELDAATRVGARPVFTIEPGYPTALATTQAPPPLLYVKGDADLLQRHSIAVVGSRNASAAGIALTRTMVSELGQAGIVIISGLARGIDTAAHNASLATGTIAVVAGGVDIIYPPENQILQTAIGERGCLVAESPPGFKPRGSDFPRRNRIIAGISRAIIVVEAAEKSGTLISARYANEYGREVFAVPGHPLDPRAAGTNRLLREGATLATRSADVLEVMHPQLEGGFRAVATDPYSPPRPVVRMSSVALSAPGDLPSEQAVQAVAAALGPHPVSSDELVRATGLSARTVQIALLELSLDGQVERHGQQLVSLKPPGGDA